MTKTRDFNIPDEMSDVILLVEGKKLHVNKAFLSTMSPMFKTMLTKNFTESKQNVVKLKGPPNSDLKYYQFLELMKVIHPPHEDLKELGNYFDIELVFRRADDFLADYDRAHNLISFSEDDLPR